MMSYRPHYIFSAALTAAMLTLAGCGSTSGTSVPGGGASGFSTFSADDDSDGMSGGMSGMMSGVMRDDGLVDNTATALSSGLLEDPLHVVGSQVTNVGDGLNDRTNSRVLSRTADVVSGVGQTVDAKGNVIDRVADRTARVSVVNGSVLGNTGSDRNNLAQANILSNKPASSKSLVKANVLSKNNNGNALVNANVASGQNTGKSLVGVNALSKNPGNSAITANVLSNGQILQVKTNGLLHHGR